MKLLSFLMLLLTSQLSNSAHDCYGAVINVDVAGNGRLQTNIEGIGDGNVICSLTEKLGEYEPESCKAAMSMLLAAKLSGKHIKLYFGNDTNTSCAKGNWEDLTTSAHQFYYIRLED